MIPAVTRIGVGLAALNVAMLTPQPLRAVVVFPLALLLPGSAFTLNFPEARPDGTLPRLAQAAVCSAAMYPLLLLGLAACSIPVHTAATLVAADALVVVLLGVAVGRALASGATIARPSLELEPPALPLWSLLAAVCLVLAGVSLFAGLRLLPAGDDPGSVSLSLARAWSHVSSVQTVASGARPRVEVAVRNPTSVGKSFRLSGRVGGTTWATRTLYVRPRSTWAGSVRGPVPPTTRPLRLLISLVPVRGGVTRSLTVYFRTRS